MEEDIKIVYWKDVRKSIQEINSTLSNLIDDIDPSPKYPLLVSSNAFGKSVVSRGNLSIGSRHKDLLTYSPIPLFLVLDKSLEVFVKNNGRIIPLNIVKRGSLIGLFETVDSIFSEQSSPPWYVSSGARSIFFTPRITDQSKYRKINFSYNLPPYKQVRSLDDHWGFLKNLSSNTNFGKNWLSKILLFTNSWFDQKKNDSKSWRNFYNYIFKEAWKVASFALSNFNVGLEWESFAQAISERHLKPSQYISDNVKHLMMICSQKLPGFMPANDSEEIAPIKDFQKFFLEVYKLKDYSPVFMHTAPLDTLSNNTPVYYSLSFPTLLEGAPGTSNNKTIVMDLMEIMLNIETIQSRLSKQESFFKNIEFSYFHTEKNAQANILPSNEVPSYDDRFSFYSTDFPGRKFPEMGQFWWGCIGMKFLKT